MPAFNLSSTRWPPPWAVDLGYSRLARRLEFALGLACASAVLLSALPLWCVLVSCPLAMLACLWLAPLQSPRGRLAYAAGQWSWKPDGHAQDSVRHLPTLFSGTQGRWMCLQRGTAAAGSYVSSWCLVLRMQGPAGSVLPILVWCDALDESGYSALASRLRLDPLPALSPSASPALDCHRSPRAAPLPDAR